MKGAWPFSGEKMPKKGTGTWRSTAAEESPLFLLDSHAWVVIKFGVEGRFQKEVGDKQTE
jgi:hypothetical protein